MTVPYTPLAIANNFVARFGTSSGIEHMKLQKLVYCSYGWWLAGHGLDADRLTVDGPEIWRHGPVFASLYRVLRVFGRDPITVPQSGTPFSQPDFVDRDDEETLSLLGWVWGRYGHLSGFALSDLTHKPGTPWHRVATENNFRVPFNTQIPDEYIFDEFKNLILERTSARQQVGIDDGQGRARA